MTAFDLALSVTHADGSVTRWGPDEPDGQDVPMDLTFGTSIPGGFKDLSCSLLRPSDRTYADESLYDGVRAYDASTNRTAWEGRIAQLPRQHGDTYGLQPGAVGWAAHLRDNAAYRAIFRDVDQSRWKTAPLARRLGQPTWQYIEPSAGSDDGGDPRVVTSLPPSDIQIFSEAWYDSQGIPFGNVEWDFSASGNIDISNAAYLFSVSVDDDDDGTGATSTGDLSTAYTGAGTLPAAATSRFAFVRARFNTSHGLTGTGLLLWRLAVVGRHGLTLQGSGLNAGFRASDIIRTIVRDGAPLLNTDAIQDFATVVPHAAFLDPGTPEDALALVNAYLLAEWGVWEDRGFFLRPIDRERLVWTGRLADGAHVDLEGDTAESLYTSVFVSYQDANGDRRTVGPPGAIAHDTTFALTSSAVTPLTEHGYERMARLDVSVPTNLPGAVAIGQAYLGERLQASRRGTITLQGTVDHPTRGPRPVWEVRAGDWVTISDRAGDLPRRIIETRYDHNTRRLTASCDNTPARLDALMARLGISLFTRGF